MKLTKKLICIYLSAITLLPAVGAMKSSVSMPENLCHCDHREEKDPTDSPYQLGKTCDRINREAPYTPIDKTIGESAELCSQTFERMYNFLCYREVPSDCFYIAALSNYEEILERINYILFDIILQKSDKMKNYFTPSPGTTVNMCNAITRGDFLIQKYEHIFHVELRRSHARDSKTKKLHRLMLNAQEGLNRIWNLDSFRQYFV